MNFQVTATTKPFSPVLIVSLLVMLLLSQAVSAQTTHDVTVGNNFFSPNNLTINVGDTVRWTNNSGSHDVTADDGSFAGPTSNSFVFSRTFNSVEEVLYYCSVHSSPRRDPSIAMNGRINVVAPEGATDVSIESLDAIDGAYQTGQDFRLTATLKNLTTEDSGMFNVRFYASTDNTVNAGDTLLGTLAISNIASEETANIDENLTLPGGMALGDYFIGAIIDLDDANPDNNIKVDETPIFVFIDFEMNAGLNDAWFERATDGQGFFIIVFPNLNLVSLAWFTYDTELPPEDALSNLGDPGNRWLTATGTIVGNQALMEVVLTSNGIFDTPTEVQRTDPPGSDGTLLLTFENCNIGSIDYDITTIDAQGTVPITRVAFDNVALCNALLRQSQLNP